MRNIPSLLSSSLGNILEWYDFGLFTIFSALFSKLFFPTDNPHTAMIATLGIFAMGFFCRPIGALLFGYLGDRKGRAQTLRLSILMISLPTLLIAFLPTYAQAGLLAPILLMLIRMWQGISIGGEYSGALVYLAESAPKHYRATFTSLASMGANIGILLAALVGIIASSFIAQETLYAWGWRIPYLLSGVFSVLIYLFRLRIKETPVFDYLKDEKQLAKNPIKTMFTENLHELSRTVGMVCVGTTFYYFCFIYIPVYLEEALHLSIQYVSVIIAIFICLMVVITPLGGFICDSVGRRKMLLFNAAFIAIIVIPGFYLLHVSLGWLALVLGVFTLASSLEQGATSIAVVENFPPPARYTGVAFGFNLGNGFLGGTVPMICAWLATVSFPLLPALYIACFAIITWLVVFFFVPETRHINLVKE